MLSLTFLRCSFKYDKWFYFLFLNLFLLVPWGEVDKNLVKEIVEFIKEEMSYDDNGKPKKPPCSSVITKRVKRYYRSQRHQCMLKSDQIKRRRQRLLNRRNRLTMVSFSSFLTYIKIQLFYWYLLHYFLLKELLCHDANMNKCSAVSRSSTQTIRERLGLSVFWKEHFFLITYVYARKHI